MNDLARIRIKLGLTRPGMLKLLGIRKGRLSLFQDGVEIDPIVAERGHEIERIYDKWHAEVTQRLVEVEAGMASRQESTVPPSVAAEALGITEFNLSQLRVRGEIQGVQVAVKHWVYTTSALYQFLKANSTHLLDEKRKRGPLAAAFTRYLRSKEKEKSAVAA